MAVLRSTIDTKSPDFARNAEAMRRTVEDLRDKLAKATRGGSDEARARHTKRGKLLVRERIDALLDPGSPFLELSPLAAYDMYDGDVASRRHRHRHRPGERPRLHDRRQRRHRQGRHLLSRHREEASARAGDRARQSTAVHLPGRFRRRLPAAAGRDFPGSRAFRPHLLQPGADVGRGHSADRRRDGLVHGRRRLCAGDVGRGHDREEPGHDIPRRAAAGEGRDRRGGDGRGARRRRSALPPVRRHRLHGRQRRACARDRAAAGRQPQPRDGIRGSRCGRRASRSIRRRTSTASCRRTRACSTTCARSSRASSMAPSSRSSSALRHTLVCGFAHICGFPVGILANNGMLFSESALKGAHFIELPVSATFRWCSCRTSRVSWSARRPRRRASPRTAPSWSLRSRRPTCRNTPSSSAAATAPAITAWRGAPTIRASSGCGRTRASR